MSDEDPTDLFDTDNVVVCQYDKVRQFFSRQISLCVVCTCKIAREHTKPI